MPTPPLHRPDEHDDAFFDYVGTLVERVEGLEKMLLYIKDNLGQVCADFADTCTHESCNSSCGAWLIADMALKGVYDLDAQVSDMWCERHPVYTPMCKACAQRLTE